ncbi:MAG: helix-hairpin-helix domain-containing protein [Halolamina sp.]
MADVDEVERRSIDAPTELKFVGPATADAIESAPFSAQAIADKEVSFRMLLDADVNPGVAAKIRRHHSLAWSFDNDGDLDRRSQQVRGLQDDEAAWVASSHGGDEADADVGVAGAAEASAADEPTDDGEAAWVAESSAERESESTDEPATTDVPDEESAWVAASSTDDATADGSGDPLAAEAAWRERSKPTPLTEISGVGEGYAERMGEAGVTSIRSLATASPELLADVTGISEDRIRRWHREASDRAD